MCGPDLSSAGSPLGHVFVAFSISELRHACGASGYLLDGDSNAFAHHRPLCPCDIWSPSGLFCIVFRWTEPSCVFLPVAGLTFCLSEPRLSLHRCVSQEDGGGTAGGASTLAGGNRFGEAAPRGLAREIPQGGARGILLLYNAVSES